MKARAQPDWLHPPDPAQRAGDQGQDGALDPCKKNGQWGVRRGRPNCNALGRLRIETALGPEFLKEGKGLGDVSSATGKATIISVLWLDQVGDRLPHMFGKGDHA